MVSWIQEIAYVSFLMAGTQNIGSRWVNLTFLVGEPSIDIFNTLKIIISRHYEGKFSLSFSCKGIEK